MSALEWEVLAAGLLSVSAAVKRTADFAVPHCDFVGFRYAPDKLFMSAREWEALAASLLSFFFCCGS